MRTVAKLGALGLVTLGGVGVGLLSTNETRETETVASRSATASSWSVLPPSPVGGQGFQGLDGVWTGREVIVLAGATYSESRVAGAAYDPVAKRWRRLARSPLGWRAGQTAVWTGSELIVWGGASNLGQLGDGARYDPTRDAWKVMARSPVPGRPWHAAVWTGEEMLVWGGGVRKQQEGAAYDPRTDSWGRTAASPLQARLDPAAVWTGREMLVWGGRAVGKPDWAAEALLSDGAAYDRRANRWRRIEGAPIVSDSSAIAVWTGTAMLVWNGTRGASYDPRRDRWTLLPKSPLGVRSGAPVVWTGRQMIAWGGATHLCARDTCYYADGASYDPRTRRWQKLPRTRLRPRDRHVAVWTGRRMFVWGGCCHTQGLRYHDDGALYRPGDAGRGRRHWSTAKRSAGGRVSHSVR